MYEEDKNIYIIWLNSIPGLLTDGSQAYCSPL